MNRFVSLTVARVVFFVFLFCYSLFWYLNNPRMLVLLLIASSWIIIGLLGFLYDNKPALLSRDYLFLATLIVFALIFCFVFPTFSIPDEGHHFFSTYWLIDQLPFNSRVNPDGSYLVRDIDLKLYSKLSTNGISSSSYDLIFNNFSFDGTAKFVTYKGMTFSIGSENVPAKIGSILGLQIALLLGLGAFPAFYLGRIGSIVFFAFCAFQAYKICPKGKSIVVFVSLLPMTLHLVASYSYDSGIIAYGLLLFACLMRGFFGEERSLTWKEIAVYLLISALFAPCKVIYCGVILLALFVPKKQFKNPNVCIVAKICLFFAISIPILAVRTASMSGLIDHDISSRGNEIGHFYTVSDIILHPRNSFMVFFRTLDSLGDFYWESCLGYSLGWLQENLRMPAIYMLPYLFFGFLCCFESQEDSSFLDKRVSPLFILAFLISVLGSIASMWLGWTFNTENIIQGVQGRYFLPALPVLLFGLRNRSFKYTKFLIPSLLFGICSMNCLYLIRFISVATCH